MFSVLCHVSLCSVFCSVLCVLCHVSCAECRLDKVHLVSVKVETGSPRGVERGRELTRDSSPSPRYPRASVSVFVCFYMYISVSTCLCMPLAICVCTLSASVRRGLSSRGPIHINRCPFSFFCFPFLRVSFCGAVNGG